MLYFLKYQCVLYAGCYIKHAYMNDDLYAIFAHCRINIDESVLY